MCGMKYKAAEELFDYEPQLDPMKTSHRVLAKAYVDAGTGLNMMVADAANQAIRHCRIGLVTLKRELH